MHYTPYSHFWGFSRAVPGVEIHGNLVSQFIGAGLDDRRLITSMTEPWEWLWIGGWTFLGALITWQWRYSHQHRWRQWKTILAMTSSVAVLIGSSYGALILGVWLPVVPPLLGLLGASGFIVAWMAQAGLQVRNTFGRYLTDQVVATLLENPEGLKMGGERRTITLLTSDLRGFTSTSETLTPEKVVSVLNLYFGAMADVITRYGGTIDEFMGDGILVLFGAPTAAADDALRAVAVRWKCSWRSPRSIREMTAMNLKPLAMGIGINTGEVVVGNIGSEKRTKYGVVGAQVNLTYRIESYTIGGQILISQTTLEQAGDTVQVAGSQTVHPKGVSEPVVVWDVIGVGQLYHLSLTKETEHYIKLDPPLTVTYACLAGKHVSDQHCCGQLSQLSQQGGFVEIPPQQPHPDPYTNLKIEIGGIHENGSATAIVYAKVIEPPEHSSVNNAGFYLYFSAMPVSLTQQLKELYQTGQVVFPGTSTAQ